MRVTASKIKGYNYKASLDFNTIGKTLFWYDYRKGASIRNISGEDLVNSLADSSANSLQLNSTLNPSSNPRLFNDGIGSNGTVLFFQNSSDLFELRKLHNGSPYLCFFVLKFDSATTIGSEIYMMRTGTQGLGKPGLEIRANRSTRQIITRLFIDNGNNLQSQLSNGTFPDDEYFLVQTMYYGNNTGTNNKKLFLQNTVNSLTLNSTSFGVQSPPYIEAFRNEGGVKFAQKLAVGWDLTGKTISEIDNFRLLALDTLLSDPEYSSLITI